MTTISIFFLIFAFSPSDIHRTFETNPAIIKGIYLAPGVFYSKYEINEFFRMADLGLVNTAVVDIKDERGRIMFSLYEDFIKKAKKNGIYLIGRQCIFKDEAMALKNGGTLALKDFSGNIWFQEECGYWVDPSLSEVREYNAKITGKAFDFGFDEVQFDYIRYPSSAKPYKNWHKKLENIVRFLDAVNEIKPEEKRISLTFYGYTVWAKQLAKEGQRFEEMAEKVDAVYPMLYPSHFHDDFMNDSTKEWRTYSLIYESVKKAHERVPEKNIEIIPYLQAFSWKRSRLGKNYILNQLIAASESQSDGFVLWEAGGNYGKGYKELIDFDIDYFKKKLMRNWIDDSKRSERNFR
jgi:hypothetical protein